MCLSGRRCVIQLRILGRCADLTTAASPGQQSLQVAADFATASASTILVSTLFQERLRQQTSFSWAATFAVLTARNWREHHLMVERQFLLIQTWDYMRIRM